MKPAVKYIKRNIRLESLQVRVDSELKREADDAAKKLNTSLNRLVEASLKWFLTELKEDGDL